jgi:NAD(P)H-dependent FMN reductase
MENIKIGIIIGSTRPGRFGDKPAVWINEIAKTVEGVKTEIIDLKDNELPFFNDAISPAYVDGKYANPVVQAWADKIKQYDGYIIIAAEYNHGYTAVLKNALDSVYKEWNNKPVAFVGYGSVGGGRAVEQLRLVAVELHMASIRNAVHISSPWLLQDKEGKLNEGALDQYTDAAKAMLNDLHIWAKAFKTIRN